MEEIAMHVNKVLLPDAELANLVRLFSQLPGKVGSIRQFTTKNDGDCSRELLSNLRKDISRMRSDLTIVQTRLDSMLENVKRIAVPVQREVISEL
jgi:hypothetical protein